LSKIDAGLCFNRHKDQVLRRFPRGVQAVLGCLEYDDKSPANFPSLVDGSDDVEDVHALQILLQSIKISAEKGLGRSN
jgi:hypothetical protein